MDVLAIIFALALNFISEARSKKCPVTYRSDAKVYPFSRLATNRNRNNLRIVGDIDWRCNDIDYSEPITFKTSGSFLKLSPWRNPRQGTFKFEFKTTEQHGLLFYGGGNSTRNFIALELFKGKLIFVFNLRSEKRRSSVAADLTLNDGRWHSVAIQRINNRIRVVVEAQETRTNWINLGRNSDITLRGPLYLGGADFSRMEMIGKTPRQLWTASLKYGFIGCINRVYKDNDSIDIKTIAKETYPGSSEIGPECKIYGESLCKSEPCRNGGKCRDGYNRFTCDCSGTAFMGSTCELPVSAVRFNGSQSLRFPFTTTVRYHAEELNFRFKTPFSNGLLFTTTSKSTADRLTVSLINGQVKLVVNTDCVRTNCTGTARRQGPSTLYQGTNLNDNEWHTVRIRRYGLGLNLAVDDQERGNTMDEGYTELEFDAIHMGKVTGSVHPRVRKILGPPFVGTIQNLMFNKNQLIDRCFQEKTQCILNGTWGESNIVSNPITFSDKFSYVSTRSLRAYDSMNIYFTLRTTVSDGLILYNSGKSGDFIAVELVGGFIQYIYNLGNGVKALSTPDQNTIGDGQWHQVRIQRDVSNSHTLSVDGKSVSQHGSRANVNLDLGDPLYIGGVRKDMYTTEFPDRIVSRFGFQGCLGTFDLSGFVPDLLGKDLLLSRGNLRQGCLGPITACDLLPCLNGGICREEWMSYSCDCSLTSYTGAKCEKHISSVTDGTSYQFNSGIILYYWPTTSLPNTRDDILVLGFMTATRNGVITRISSNARDRRTTKDYMQLEVEDGRLTLRFNIGTKDIVLKDPTFVSDGQYHRVAITRVWMNATMQVDSSPKRKVAPSGNARKRYDFAATSIPLFAKAATEEWLRGKEAKNTVFNSQSTIQIGGRLSEALLPQLSGTRSFEVGSNLDRPFIGLISGFSFNKMKVLSLAKTGNPNIMFGGIVKPVKDTPGVTPTPSTESTTTAFTYFTTTSAKPVSVKAQNDSGCDAELCSEEGGLNPEETMQGDDQTSQITPRVDFPPIITVINGVASPEATIKGTQQTTVKTVFIDTNGTSKNNGSGGLYAGDNPDVKTGLFGNFFNGTTAMIAGIVGSAVLTIVLLLFAIFKYKRREDNAYHMGQRESPHSNGTIVNGGKRNRQNGSIKMKNGSIHSNEKIPKEREMDKEYYV